MIDTVRSLTALRRAVGARRAAGKRLALVPTMGALHEGHLTLIDMARKHADEVVVSLFVNPAQFAPGEDLDRYPRDEAADQRKVHGRGASILWAPAASDMYPQGFATSVRVAGPALGLETDHRPHFFTGVATIVTKLLVQVLPDVAVFGEKDYQQLQVIRRLTADLNLPTEIIGGPTIREADGLALSSRNAYLSTAERRIAPALRQALQMAGDRALAGDEPSSAEAAATRHVLDAGFQQVDYIAVRHAHSLAPLQASDIADGQPVRVLAAAHLGTTRLIDNLDPRAA